jgi:hypothetical protein
LVSAWLEWVVVKKYVPVRLECIIVKGVSFSMAGMCYGQKDNYRLSGMYRGQKVSFSMFGLCRGQNVSLGIAKMCRGQKNYSAWLECLGSARRICTLDPHLNLHNLP